MAWEEPFEAKIRRSRDEELRQLRKSYICEIIFEAIWLASPVICILVSFLWYTKVQGEVLTPSIAFTSLGASETGFERVGTHIPFFVAQLSSTSSALLSQCATSLPLASLAR